MIYSNNYKLIILHIIFILLAIEASKLNESETRNIKIIKIINNSESSSPKCSQTPGYDVDDDTFCFSSTSKIKNQISLANWNTGSTLTINFDELKYGFFDYENSFGFVVDVESDFAYIVYGDWKRNMNSLPSLNLSDVILNYSPQDFDSCMESDLAQQMAYCMSDIFEPESFGLIKWEDNALENASTLFNSVHKAIQFLMQSYTSVLHSVLDLKHDGWLNINYGAHGIFSLFKSLTDFVASFSGGYCGLVDNAVRFSLRGILSAENGMEAFVRLLKSIEDKFDLTLALRKIIHEPYKVAKLISGLGGSITSGISGIYLIVSKILRLSQASNNYENEALKSGFNTSINDIARQIIEFTKTRNEGLYDFNHKSMHELQQLVERQHRYFNNKQRFGVILDLLNAWNGKSFVSISGVNISKLFQILTKHESGSAITISITIFNQLRAIFPLGYSLPHLVYATVDMLNKPQGINTLNAAIPDLDVNSLLTGEKIPLSSEIAKNMPTTKLFHNLPIAKELFEKYKTTAEKLTKSDNDELEKHINQNIALRSALLLYGGL